MKTESGTAEATDSLCAHTLLSPKRLPGAPRILSRFSDTPRSAKSNPRTDSPWRRLLLPIRTPSFRATAFHTSHLGRNRLRIMTDTANYSKAALGSSTAPSANLESVLFVDSSALDGGATGRRYLAQWMRVLSRWADQSATVGEPSYSVAAERLTALADWPTLTAAFVAHEARTAFGEEVSVLGDLDVLGRWGSSRGGVMLGTGPTTYPTWHSLGSMSLAVGQWFDWKLAVRWGTAPPHRWESGTNRSSLAIEPVFSRGSSIVYQATWR